MLENLINLVKENAGEAIVNNPEVPNENNDKAIEVTGNSIMDTLRNAVSGGDISQLTSLFNGDANNAETSELAGNAKSDVVSNLIEKLGLSPEIAQRISQTVVPLVMAKLVGKTNNPNDNSFNIQDMLGNLTGDAGGFDLGSVLGKINSSNSDREKSGSGSLGDTLGGMFGK